MIDMRRAQLSFGDGLIAEEVSDLREDWMKHADVVLADEEIVATVYEALAKRHPKSRCRGRRGAPADMVLRLLILKHIRNWSYEVLEREVRANLVYRDFTHVGGAKTPDAKTMGRWGLALGPQVLKQVQARDRENSPRQRCNRGTTDACGHDCGGDRHPPSDRQHLIGGWRAGADPHHAQDYKDCGRGRNQVARPQPEREAAAAGDRTGGTRQRLD